MAGNFLQPSSGQLDKKDMGSCVPCWVARSAFGRRTAGEEMCDRSAATPGVLTTSYRASSSMRGLVLRSRERGCRWERQGLADATRRKIPASRRSQERGHVGAETRGAHLANATRGAGNDCVEQESARCWTWECLRAASWHQARAGVRRTATAGSRDRGAAYQLSPW